MKFFLLWYVWLVYHLEDVYGDEGFSEHGSCSRKCQNTTQQDSVPMGGDSLLRFPCSCSPSCALYKDCCYDSPYRNEDKKLNQEHTMCLSISGRGHYRVVSNCPSHWNLSSRFCTGSIGHLPPVTSKTSGMSYANIYCAVCNGEVQNLKTWNVELGCCPEHESFDDRRYVYKNNHLWSVVSKHNKCLCRYHVHGNDFSILQDLELRSCNNRLEISRCSSGNNSSLEEQQQCSSFLDPVYVGGKVYRNKFCAKCNFQRVDTAKCMPQVVEDLSLMGVAPDEIRKYCVQNRLTDCVYYFSSYVRGLARPFSNLLNINEISCMPTGNNRCCRGERYDYKAKKCRKMDQRRSLF